MREFKTDSIRPALVTVPDAWNQMTQRVIACAMEVHTILGPGLLERLYEDALAYELSQRGLRVERQRSIRVRYKTIELSEQRLDLVVENLVVVELKSTESVPEVFLAQLMSYLRSADLPLGLLINFNELRLAEGLFRRLNQHSSCFNTLPTSPRSSSSSASSAFDPIR
jgi:GxxExxY protein